MLQCVPLHLVSGTGPRGWTQITSKSETHLIWLYSWSVSWLLNKIISRSAQISELYLVPSACCIEFWIVKLKANISCLLCTHLNDPLSKSICAVLNHVSDIKCKRYCQPILESHRILVGPQKTQSNRVIDLFLSANLWNTL